MFLRLYIATGFIVPLILSLIIVYINLRKLPFIISPNIEDRMEKAEYSKMGALLYLAGFWLGFIATVILIVVAYFRGAPIGVLPVLFTFLIIQNSFVFWKMNSINKVRFTLDFRKRSKVDFNSSEVIEIYKSLKNSLKIHLALNTVLILGILPVSFYQNKYLNIIYLAIYLVENVFYYDLYIQSKAKEFYNVGSPKVDFKEHIKIRKNSLATIKPNIGYDEDGKPYLKV